MVAKDDVDMESLQAQIDLSMSFAHDLVTSWIKPTHLAQLGSSKVTATQILEEELRRPPRLGVGASIPTAPPLALDASKLKHRLGKSGARKGGVVEPQPQDSSKPDDEEYKGRPTKRKARADPFQHEGNKKKKKAESTTNPYPSAEIDSKHSASLLNYSSLGESAKHSSSSGKEKQRKGLDEKQSQVPDGPTSMSSPPMKLFVRSRSFPSLPAPTVSSFSEPSGEISAPVPGKSTTPESNRAHTNFMRIPDQAKPLGIPLLNLDGPPELTDKPGITSELNISKKKRKRRKKKKKQMITGTGDD